MPQDDSKREAKGEIGILVGALLSDHGRATADGVQGPRIDIYELERKLGATMFDLSTIASRQGRLWNAGRRIASRTGTWSLGLGFLAAWRLRKAKAIYATGEDVGLPLALGLMLLLNRRTRLVLRIEQLEYGRSELRRRLYRVITKLAMSRVDVSLYRTQAYAAYGRQFKRPVATWLPECTDSTFFKPESKSPEDMPVVFSAGLELRDYETLIKATAGLNCRVVIAAGSPWSHETNTTMSAEHVSWTLVPRTEMPGLYWQSTVVVVSVHPTRRACGMNVVLEGWACGRPVVVTETEGLRSYIEPGENCLAVNTYDVDGLRAAIASLLDDDDMAASLATQGRRQAETAFTLDRYVDEVSGHLLVGAGGINRQ